VRNHLCPPILGGTLISSFLIELDHLVPAPLTAALGRRSSTERTYRTSSAASFLPKRRALIAFSFDQPPCTRETYVATAYLVIPTSFILEISLPKYRLICPSMSCSIHTADGRNYYSKTTTTGSRVRSVFAQSRDQRILVANRRRLHLEVYRWTLGPAFDSCDSRRA
jgi:hypothetical protein